jgi:hypothetical protein
VLILALLSSPDWPLCPSRFFYAQPHTKSSDCGLGDFTILCVERGALCVLGRLFFWENEYLLSCRQSANKAVTRRQLTRDTCLTYLLEESPVTLVFDQPKPVDMKADFRYFPGHQAPPAMPQPTSYKKQTMGSFGKRSTQIMDTLSRPWTSQGKSRMVIGAPTNFRKLTNFDLTESPPVARPRPNPGRRAFRPLELSIYMPDGRLSPLPDFDHDEWSRPADLSIPQPAVLRDNSILVDDGISNQFDIRRDPISELDAEEAAAFNFESTSPTVQQHPFGAALPGLVSEAPISPTTYSVQRSFSTAIRPRTSASPFTTRSPQPSVHHSRSLSDLVRPLRSSSIVSRPRDTVEIDEAIRELNTIVEERRYSALQKSIPSSQSQSYAPVGSTSPVRHIPAIAPSMVVRARSQTLSDIGSAFTTPFPGSGPMARPTSAYPNAMPLTTPSPALTKTSSTSSKSRLRTFFSRSASTASKSRTRSSSLDFQPSTPKHSFRDAAGQTQYSGASSIAEEMHSEDNDGQVFSPTTTVVSGTTSYGYGGSSFTAATTPMLSPSSYSENKEQLAANSANMYAFPHPLHSHTIYPRSWLAQGAQAMPLKLQQHQLLQQQHEAEQYYSSPSTGYYPSSTESSPVRVPPIAPRFTSRRGLSVDTTMTSSSVGTSILGGLAGGETELGKRALRDSQQVRISGVDHDLDGWDENGEMVIPGVGVAF